MCNSLEIACFSLKLSYPGIGSWVHRTSLLPGKRWLSALLCLRSKGSRCFSGAALWPDRLQEASGWLPCFRFNLCSVAILTSPASGTGFCRPSALHQDGSGNAVVFRTRQQTLALLLLRRKKKWLLRDGISVSGWQAVASVLAACCVSCMLRLY